MSQNSQSSTSSPSIVVSVHSSSKGVSNFTNSSNSNSSSSNHHIQVLALIVPLREWQVESETLLVSDIKSMVTERKVS